MELEELRKLQKQEALERLKILQQVYKVHPNVLKEFQQDNKIYFSERINKFYNGILYWLDTKPEYIETVKEIENKYSIYVYHCILNHTEFGDWLSMLYVSNSPDEWKDERLELQTGTPYAYVYTFDEFNSEIGPIQIAGINGGLTRLN